MTIKLLSKIVAPNYNLNNLDNLSLSSPAIFSVCSITSHEINNYQNFISYKKSTFGWSNNMFYLVTKLLKNISLPAYI